jgi:hypothetical protein
MDIHRLIKQSLPTMGPNLNLALYGILVYSGLCLDRFHCNDITFVAVIIRISKFVSNLQMVRWFSQAKDWRDK